MRIGDRVRWMSKSKGYATEKRGVVVAIVPVYGNPHDYIPKGFRAKGPCGFGSGRSQESYLIKVNGAGWSVYWPHVCHLRKG